MRLNNFGGLNEMSMQKQNKNTENRTISKSLHNIIIRR